MTKILALSLVTVASLMTANTTFAQAERTIDSNNMTPGTSVPMDPTDSVQRANKKDDGAIRLPGKSMDVDQDAGSAKKTRRAKAKKLTPDQQEQQELFPNERQPRIDPNALPPQ